MYPDKFALILAGTIFFSFIFRAQTDLASAQLKNMHGKVQPFSAITQKDSIVLVCFWATTSDESVAELNAINAKYESWKMLAKFRLMVVSVDEGKAANKVRPMLNMNDWIFDVYLDINGDLRKALKSNNLPQSMVIKGGRVIYEQSGYEPGSEDYLLQRIQGLMAGKQ